MLQNASAAPAFNGHLARRLVRRLNDQPEPQLVEAPFDAAAFQRVVGTYRLGAASIDVHREASRLVLSSKAAWHVTESTFGHEGNGVFAAIGNPEFRMQFSGGGDHDVWRAMALAIAAPLSHVSDAWFMGRCRCKLGD